MAVEIHITVFDPEVAARKGKPAEIGVSFLGMTPAQRTGALQYLHRIVAKLEEHEKKYPEGVV